MDTESSTTKKHQMKIGIVSLYGWLKLWDNYGTLLQNFALQTVLRHRGHSTFWIRTRPTPPGKNRLKEIYSKIVSNLRALLRLLATPLIGQPASKRLADFNQRNPRHFEEFMARHVPTTPKEFTIEELINESPDVDILIVGSDQIWRDPTKLNFLDFGPRHIRRVAYAVSAPWTVLGKSWFQSAIQFTQQLDAVSVREVEGLPVCEELLINGAVHVIDPVLLLEETEYLNIVRQDGEDRSFSRPFVLGYFVNVQLIDQIPWEPIVGFASGRKSDLRVVPMQGAELVIPEQYSFAPSPSAWINAFHKADCVVTNSYHGALFAIVMRKPFLVFLQCGTKSHENCRFTSALEPLGLDNRILAHNSWHTITTSKLDEQMSCPIDWVEVELALTKWKNSSMEFLDIALKT